MGIVSLGGCKPDPSMGPDTSGQISFAIPAGWPQPVYTFQNNTLTQEGFALGRKLFFDPRLSRDSSTSCGTCHQQFAGFANLDHPLSHGINGLFGNRNSPGLSNLAWYPAFFYDGGVNHIESQPINPITNPVEMDETLPRIVSKLSADANYRSLFKSAFGDEAVNSQRIFRALAQFMGAMVSSNSKYDHYVRGEAGGTLSPQELHGMQLFNDKCATCHQPPLFTDFSYRNNGLSPDAILKDSGRAHITGLPGDIRKFKVPSLRNVELSRPYMHDGRFITLDAAVEHYRTDIMVSPTLDPLLTSGIVMTDADKQDIISFLKTLTDMEFVKDKRFFEPR